MRTQIIQVIRVFKVENLYYNNSLLAFNYFVSLIILDNLFIPYVSVWRYLSYLCSTTSIIHRETSGMNIWCWPQFHPSDMPSGKKCYFWYLYSFVCRPLIIRYVGHSVIIQGTKINETNFCLQGSESTGREKQIITFDII